MESSNRKALFCQLRRERVADLPEERVRQALIAEMVGSLGYPKQTLIAEQLLGSLPHLASLRGELPSCRFDLLCLAHGIHPLHPFYPLLLAECKAVPLSEEVFEQIIGYNHFVKAFFLVVANSREVLTGRYCAREKRYLFEEGLPRYEDLRLALSESNML